MQSLLVEHGIGLFKDEDERPAKLNVLYEYKKISKY